jgi:hypothetical protein
VRRAYAWRLRRSSGEYTGSQIDKGRGLRSRRPLASSAVAYSVTHTQAPSVAPASAVPEKDLIECGMHAFEVTEKRKQKARLSRQ